tara:strand:- start:769 stop:987 length:219 start_codon:yes stop_codon:yes gene_type:complete
MPAPRKYEYETEEERMLIRKNIDKQNHFIKYWEKHYKLKINIDDIEMIKQYKTHIKGILPILDFVKRLQLIE